ncbi:MAG TPA: TRAP transporter large permease [Rectinemataceae bacterium]|nr:TRAP transporter large permease [Rectinemataceae bacterium]
MTVALWLLFLVLMVIGVPVAFSMGLSSILMLLASDAGNAVVIAQKAINGLDSFTILAIPFFMLSAAIMSETGVGEKIFDFASALVRHIPGGLGHVNIISSVIQAGMSGSAVSDITGMGRLEITAMEKDGFDTDFSAAVTAASSTIGPIIPPSIPMVLYGSISGVSIGRLLIGGLFPGIMMAIGMMIVVYIVAKKRHYPIGKRAHIKELAITFVKSVPALIMPLILMGGMLNGFMTPTESAGVAVLYSIFLGMVFYRNMSFKKLFKIAENCSSLCSTTMFIISAAAILGLVLTQQQVPQKLTEFFIGLSSNPAIILFAVNLLLLVLGCVMETTAIFVILTPILSLLAIKLGVDPVAFGVMVVFNVTIALITPPVGMVMFLTCKIANITTKAFLKAIAPFLIMLIICLMLITYIPEISTWLPNLVMGR